MPVKLTLPVNVVIAPAVTTLVISIVALVLCKKPPKATTLACPVIVPSASYSIPPLKLLVKTLSKLIVPPSVLAPVLVTLLSNVKSAVPNPSLVS